MEGSGIFNRASVNVSGVHYEEREKYPIDSATGQTGNRENRETTEGTAEKTERTENREIMERM